MNPGKSADTRNIKNEESQSTANARLFCFLACLLVLFGMLSRVVVGP